MPSGRAQRSQARWHGGSQVSGGACTRVCYTVATHQLLILSAEALRRRARRLLPSRDARSVRRSLPADARNSSASHQCVRTSLPLNKDSRRRACCAHCRHSMNTMVLTLPADLKQTRVFFSQIWIGPGPTSVPSGKRRRAVRLLSGLWVPFSLLLFCLLVVTVPTSLSFDSTGTSLSTPCPLRDLAALASLP